MSTPLVMEPIRIEGRDRSVALTSGRADWIPYTERNLIGQRFAMLKILAFAGRDKKSNLSATVQCDCGTKKEMLVKSLLAGHSVSCGCRAKVHGMRWTKEYSIWCAMRARCERPKNKCYAIYGGRGIKVCERWQTFTNFYADMGQCPEGCSIDRRDPNGDYEPGNCRWATPHQQAQNRRGNRNYTSRFKGVSFRKDSGKWRAGIHIGGKNIRLGDFDDEIAAAKAYDAAALRFHGPDAFLNFPAEQNHGNLKKSVGSAGVCGEALNQKRSA
jgi:hypothetical protein